jgi:hypothetical protein
VKSINILEAACGGPKTFKATKRSRAQIRQFNIDRLNEESAEFGMMLVPINSVRGKKISQKELQSKT